MSCVKLVATAKGFADGAGGEETALRLEDPELTFILPLSGQAVAQLSPPPPTETLPRVGGLTAPEAGPAGMWPPMGWTGELPNKLTPVLGVLDETIVGAAVRENASGDTSRKSFFPVLIISGTGRHGSPRSAGPLPFLLGSLSGGACLLSAPLRVPSLPPWLYPSLAPPRAPPPHPP